MQRFLFAVILVLPSLFCPQCASEDLKPERWEKEIVGIEERMAAGKSPGGSVLFVGGSSIRLWKLDESFPELKTSNHGFGGSHLSDSVHFFDRIVAPVKPSFIVVYAGDNDIAAGKTPETVHDDYCKFADLVHQKVPTCRKVIYITIKPSVKRWALAEQMQKVNSLIKATCEKNSNLLFADIWGPMLNAEGMPRPDLLVEDGLHMNADGYRIWTNMLKPHLQQSEQN